MEWKGAPFRINTGYYQHMISIGNKCISRIALDSLGLSKSSFPFDWVPTQPGLILKYLMNNASDFLPEKPSMDRNKDDVWFGHFDLRAVARKDLEDKFARRFERLKQCLSAGEKILFVYTTESDVYNEMKSRENKVENYNQIKNLVRYLHTTYPKAVFDVLCIHTNDEVPCEQIGNTQILNTTVYVAPEHLSMNMETHVHATVSPYRDLVTKVLKEIFTLPPQ